MATETPSKDPRPAGLGGDLSILGVTALRAATRRHVVRLLEQVRRFHAEYFREPIHDVDTRCINASFERADIGAIDTGTMRQFLLRQTLRLAMRLQIVCQNLSYLHAGEDTAL